MHYDSLFMFFLTYFFYISSLAIRIAVLYFCRLRKVSCAFSLTFKSRVFFSFLLYRHICIFIFARSEVHHVISCHQFIYVFEIVLSQALVIQLVNSAVAYFGFLERFDGFVPINSSPSLFQSAFCRLYDSLFSFACCQ